MENTQGYRLTKERLEEILRGEGVNERIIAVMWPPPEFIPEWLLTDPLTEEVLKDLAREYVRTMPEVFA